MSQESQTILNVRDLSIGWEGHKAVDQISFDIHCGEKIALVGESGSGKSVTALACLGLLAGADVSGRILFTKDSGEQVDLVTLSEKSFVKLRGREIGMIFQEPMTALDPLFNIGDQIVEGIVLHEGISKQAAWRKAVELLDRTGVQEPHKRATFYPHQLSGGQRQRAMIAMALACGPRLLLADEPTTALDVTLRVQIMELLDRLQQEDGMAVVLISHDLGIVRHFAQRMAVMEKGKLVEQGTVHDVFNTPEHPYTKRLLNSRPKRLVDHMDKLSIDLNKPVVQAKDVRVSYPASSGKARSWAFWNKQFFNAVNDASIKLQPGYTLGIIGESGSGKSTLAMAILDLLPRKQVFGDIEICGKKWPSSIKDERQLRAQIQVVFQDPFSSLSPRMTVGDIVAEGLLVHQPNLGKNDSVQKVVNTLDDVGLSADIINRYPHEFSGGQRQRIAIARALIVNPSIIVLDEPTSALDVSIQMQVLELLARLQKEKQLSYILITHDVGVIRALAHEVVVMRSGQIVESGTVDQILNAPQERYTQILVNAAREVD